MENNDIYKLMLRIAKDSENFQELKRNVLARIKQRQLKITPKQYVKDKINKSNNLIYTYAIILNQNSNVNDFSIYITTQIGVDETFKLFEDFLTENYGINTLNAFKNNISEKFIKEQLISLPIIPNQTGIKSIPFNAYLFYAFLWDDSKERDSFWRHINEHWIKKCNEIIACYIRKTRWH
jgi:hypothetical protein